MVRRQFDFRGARQLAARRRRLRTRDVQQPMARERKQSRADQNRTQRRNHRRGAGETRIPPRHSFLSHARLDGASHPRLRPAGDLLHTWGPRRGNRPAHSERNDTGDRKRQGTGHPAFRGGRFHRRRQDDGGFHAAEDVPARTPQSARHDRRSSQRIRRAFQPRFGRAGFGQSRTSLLDVQVRRDGGHHLRRPQTQSRRKRCALRGHQVRQDPVQRGFRRLAPERGSPPAECGERLGQRGHASALSNFRCGPGHRGMDGQARNPATPAPTCARSSIGWRR